MTSRAVLIATAAAVAALVCGCTSQPPAPAPLTAAQKAKVVRTEVDRQWLMTGLDGVVPRPPAPESPSVGGFPGQTGLYTCLDDAGLSQWGYDDSDGFGLYGATGELEHAKEPAQQLAWFACFSRFPAVSLLSQAERDAIYDYYSTWLVPCLESQGYHLAGAPTRAQFVTGLDYTTGAQVWNPYWALTDYPHLEADLVELQNACAPTVPGIEGWSSAGG